MATVSQVMSTDVQVVRPQETLRSAARMMQELDVGSLPVCDGQRLLGMLTDRDITVRGVAEGLKPDESCVGDVMTGEVLYCTQDQSADEALRMMGEQQVRRLPVVDADKRLVGVVSLGDLATRGDSDVDNAVREISKPSGLGAL
jgi:CBS domain-containing protein